MSRGLSPWLELFTSSIINYQHGVLSPHANTSRPRHALSSGLERELGSVGSVRISGMLSLYYYYDYLSKMVRKRTGGKVGISFELGASSHPEEACCGSAVDDGLGGKSCYITNIFRCPHGMLTE